MSSDHADDGDELASVSEDADDYIDKARLRSLFEARDEAAEAIRESSLRQFEIERQYGDDTDAAMIIDEHVRQSVLAYVLEAEPLLQNTDAGQEVWEDAGLAPVALPSPPSAEWDGDPSMKVNGVPNGMLDLGRNIVHVPGIGHYVSLDTPFTVVWSGFTHGGGVTERKRKITLSRATSEDVFRTINELLADLGIGIDAEAASNEEVSYDYSDLI